MNSNEQAQLDRLVEVMQRTEELDPELARWVEDGPLGPCIKHPLVYSIIHGPTANALVNAQLKAKKEALARAKADQEWGHYVFLHERPYRLDAFRNISWHLDGPDYWTLLGQVWSDTENCWQNMDAWREMLTADPEGRELMSSEDVRCVFTLTPEVGGLLPLTRIYRGYCHDDARESFSWTLDRARAKWFATRLRQDDDPQPKIVSGYVAREFVIAYITSRDEQEIVCLPEHVIDTEIEELE